MSSVLRFSTLGTAPNLVFWVCLAFRKALAFHRHMFFVRVVVQHCSSLLVENCEVTLSDTIFDKLSVMIIVSFSTGVKVVFEEMKSFVQLEISRCMLSKLACFHKRIFWRVGL